MRYHSSQNKCMYVPIKCLTKKFFWHSMGSHPCLVTHGSRNYHLVYVTCSIYVCMLLHIFTDRIVDELNPERCLSKSEIASLMAPLVCVHLATCHHLNLFLFPSLPYHRQLTFSKMMWKSLALT